MLNIRCCVHGTYSATLLRGSQWRFGKVRMPDNKRVLERAFELARSGEFRQIDEIRLQLRREGYAGIDAQLTGPLLRRQLRALCVRAVEARSNT